MLCGPKLTCRRCSWVESDAWYPRRKPSSRSRMGNPSLPGSRGSECRRRVVSEPSVQPPRHALFHESRLPAPDGGPADTGCAHDRRRTQPVGRGQHDPGPPELHLGAAAVVNEHLSALSIGRSRAHRDASAHPEDSHTGKLVGIPQRALMSASVHSMDSSYRPTSAMCGIC